MKALAPGKLILSGEHAVLYGAPALAVAVDRHAQTTISSRSGNRRGIGFNLVDLNYHLSTTVKRLMRLMHRLSEKHSEFLQQKRPVTDILQRPYELAQFVAILVLKRFSINPDNGIDIAVSSSIPMGCGMGSSAATTVSVLYAIAHFFRLPLSDNLLLKLAQEAEKLQHGHSSGLDLTMSLHGGCMRFQEKRWEQRQFSADLPLYLIHSGKPEVGTGACVAHAQTAFREAALVDAFTAVTDAMESAMLAQDLPTLRTAIQENQRLLDHIGVVPQKVIDFSAALASHGGAAKICGAGSISGDAGGFLLALSPDGPPLALCDTYGFTCQPLRFDVPGARAEPSATAAA